MASEKKTKANRKRRKGPISATGDVADCVEEAYFAALAAEHAGTGDRDDYVKVAITLLAVGKALKAKDSAKLGALASAARRVLGDLGVNLTPKLTYKDPETGEEKDAAPDDVGGSLLQKKDFAERAGIRVKELLDLLTTEELLSDEHLGALFGRHLARLVMSGPWRAICRQSGGQQADGQRIAAALRLEITKQTDVSSLAVRRVLQVTLETLGASEDESRAATRRA